MGCGCGGRKSGLRGRSVAPPVPSSPSRQVRTQSNQRQVLVQQAKERLTQANGQSPSVVSQNEAERKRRIQISLRNKNTRTQGNQ